MSAPATTASSPSSASTRRCRSPTRHGLPAMPSRRPRRGSITFPRMARGYELCWISRKNDRSDAMDVRAAVALAAGKPLEVTTVRLDGPKAGEVLVEIKATGICHTDAFTLSGADPEGLFPAILGHEGAGIVVDVGAGVTSVKK